MFIFAIQTITQNAMRKIVNKATAYLESVRTFLSKPRIRRHLRRFFTSWLFISLFILPGILDIENLTVCLAYVINCVIAVLLAKKFNPLIFSR